MNTKADQFTFDPEAHIGRVNGIVWPSVTQLLQEFKLVDYSGVDPEVLERKRRLGIRVHAATVLLDEGRLDEEHFNKNFPECVPYLEAYRKFRVIENFEPSYKEERYVSHKWKFHGQPDESGIHTCKIGQETALIDYKCTFQMYASTGPQLAGYDMLLEECRGVKTKKRFGLLLKPSGSFELYPFTDKSDYMDFQCCIHLHWQKRNKYKTTKGEPQNDNARD